MDRPPRSESYPSVSRPRTSAFSLPLYDITSSDLTHHVDLVYHIGCLFSPEINRYRVGARCLRAWLDASTFCWLITEEILSEYKTVLGRLGVRRHFIGAFINYLREEAEEVEVRRSALISPDPGGDPFCNCAQAGRADFLVTLNPRDFPQERLTARVIAPWEPIPTAASRLSRS